MTPSLTQLPDLILLNIFKRIPAWEMLQLSSLHHRLKDIKREVFRKQTQLRLFGGRRTTKHTIRYLKNLMNFLDVDQNEVGSNHDLILKLDNSDDYYLNEVARRGEEVIELSHDIHVHNLEQIVDLAQMFPNLKKLTVASLTNDWECRSLEQLLRNWPKLTHLYFVDFEDDGDYDNVIMAINGLHDLQVLAINYQKPTMSSSKNWPLKMLEPLLQNSTKLHTLYFPVDYCTRFVRSRIQFEDPYRGRRLNASLQIPFDRIERFGMKNYWPERENNYASKQFVSKTTRLEITISTKIRRQLVNWSSLQYLCLIICLQFNSLRRLFDSLGDLRKLHEFHLFDLSDKSMPLESCARQLPQLPSVRQFEFCSMTSPYELYRFKWTLPNVAELRLKLIFPVGFKGITSFCSNIKTELGDALPESCVLDIKRAFLAYGSEIAHFYWIYYRNGRKDDGQAELVLLMERCTKIIAGMKRLNFDSEEIEY